MAFSLIASGEGVGSISAINTTGADLLVIVAAYDSGATVSDNKGNTWTGLTASGPAGVGDTYCRVWYVRGGTVGSGHTFSLSISYGWIGVAAFSGAAASPFDVQNGQTAGGSTNMSTGSVTPTQDNELVIAGLCAGNNASSIAINSSFTIAKSRNGVSGSNYGGAIAYKIQTTATAENPQFSWVNAAAGAARIATFKAAAASGSPYTMTASTGSFSLTGNATGLKAARNLTAAQASFALTGNAAGLKAGRKIAAAVASFTLTGIDATLTKSGSGAKVLTADVANFALTGNATGLKAARKIAAAVGTFALTGHATGLAKGFRLTAAARSYTLTGNAVSFKRTYALQAQSASYVITGMDVSLSYSGQGIWTPVSVASGTWTPATPGGGSWSTVTPASGTWTPQ